MKRPVKSLTQAALFAAILSFPAFSQDEGAQSAKKPGSPIVTQDVNPRLKLTISMRAQDASLSEILKILADRSGMNFVTGEGVYKEKITIILNRTPVDEAIDLVVRAAGLSYEIIGNSVLIAEADKLKGEVGQQGYVVGLKYVNAEEVANMLVDLTKFIKVDKGGNRLICFTSPRVINEIERIVKSIDHPHILVMLETRILEVSVEKMKDYGLTWAELMPIQGGLSHPEVSLKPGYNKSDWKLGGLDFRSRLDMLVQNDDARVLMNSKMTTTNNREATLQIGDVIPYQIQSYNMAGMGGGANMNIQKENVGVILIMTPHVNENNQVTLQLEPEVSNIAGWKGQFGDMPLTRVRRTRTTVRVKDGETIFLAGLLSEETSSNITKLPVLGDIPLLGRLFQHKSEITTKKNLIIEITPKILADSAPVRTGNTGESGGQGVDAPRIEQPAQIEPAPAPAPAAPAAPVQKK